MLLFKYTVLFKCIVGRQWSIPVLEVSTAAAATAVAVSVVRVVVVVHAVVGVGVGVVVVVHGVASTRRAAVVASSGRIDVHAAAASADAAGDDDDARAVCRRLNVVAVGRVAGDVAIAGIGRSGRRVVRHIAANRFVDNSVG